MQRTLTTQQQENKQPNLIMGKRSGNLTKEDVKNANKHMNRCLLTLYVISKLQIKTHIIIPRVQKNKIPNADKDVEQLECSSVADGNAKWYNLFGRQSTSFLQN